ncbi:polysaccharide biosynthesis tyrosine autokinase (plasmid) [Shinella sp. H4-D48]|uniref:polysaccharide biosynthesis tyrosine autokinase n=1 Tax=Shinella sp. H4-D48 TaxID=2925841 RepID=UPI001F53855C|nr:polysaccharide biosynthesis tyrosine autokinase [Shinella sp. H4-D48]UNK40968.1 polysaccharide biosynthesis tyrosine autokinase [Shinella sp. H4-D48]
MHQRTVTQSRILHREPDPSDSFIDLNRLMTILVRRARLIALSVAVAVALAVAYLVFATPIYTSMTQILLDEDLSRYAEESEPSPQSSQQVDMRIASAVEILKSGRLALRVVDDLKLADNETVLNPPQSPVATVKGWAKSLASLGSSGPEASQEALAKGRRDKAASILQQSLAVERVSRSAVLAVSFRSTDPQLAAAVTRRYSEAFFEDQLSANFTATEQASTWLQERLTDIQTRAQDAALEVERYRSENGLTTARGELMSEQQLADLNSQLILAQADAASASARYAQFRAIVDQGPDKAIDNASIPTQQTGGSVLQDLRERYNSVVKRAQDITQNFGADHPQAIALRAEKENLAGQIYRELQQLTASFRNEYEVSRSREVSLRESIRKVTGSNADANLSSVHLRELEQKATALKALSESYLARYEQASQKQSFPIPKARVISDAGVPTSASSPNKTMVLGLAAVLGLMAGGALTFVQEMRERAFRLESDIRSILELKPLGYLPLIGGTRKGRPATIGAQAVKSESGPGSPTGEDGEENVPLERMTRVVLDAPRSVFAETLRNAKLISDMTILSKNRVIGVTSALPGEGKSTVAINFAALLAASGRRTLLIDADMRRPSLGAIMKPAPQAGLVEALMGTISWGQAVKTDRQSQLSMLPIAVQPGGACAPHVNDLISSPAMQQLIEEARQAFDYVIVDLPPLAPVIDAKAFEPLADGFLFVVEWGRTPANLVRDLLAAESRIDAKTIGVILNKTDMDTLPRYSDAGTAEKYRDLYQQYYVDQMRGGTRQ